MGLNWDLLMFLQRTAAFVRKTAVFSLPLLRRTSRWNPTKNTEPENGFAEGLAAVLSNIWHAHEKWMIIGFLIISAISNSKRCNLWRTTLQRKADGYEACKQSLSTFYDFMRPDWMRKHYSPGDNFGLCQCLLILNFLARFDGFSKTWFRPSC